MFGQQARAAAEFDDSPRSHARSAEDGENPRRDTPAEIAECRVVHEGEVA